MKMTIKLVVGLICAGVLLTGCVSKSFVLNEIQKNKSLIDSEQGKKLDDSITKVSTDLTKRIITVETEYVSKNFLQSELYNHEQKLMKEIDTRIEAMKTLVEEIHTKMENFKLANQEDITTVSKDLRAVMDSLFRQFNAQKEGLEQAMGEIEKLSLPKSNVKTPETTPPENK